MFSVLDGSRITVAVALRILAGKTLATSSPAHLSWHRRNSTGVRCSAGESARAVYLPAAPYTSGSRRRWRGIGGDRIHQRHCSGAGRAYLDPAARVSSASFAEVQSRQLMTELAHVNRFSTAGELTASIAHEINQPLGAILTNAETAHAILKSRARHRRTRHGRTQGYRERYCAGRPARQRSDPEDAQPAEKSAF